jgi:hypothetical protein
MSCFRLRRSPKERQGSRRDLRLRSFAFAFVHVSLRFLRDCRLTGGITARPLACPSHPFTRSAQGTSGPLKGRSALVMSPATSRRQTAALMPACRLRPDCTPGSFALLFAVAVRSIVPLRGTTEPHQERKKHMNKVKNAQQPKAAPAYQNHVRLVG